MPPKIDCRRRSWKPPLYITGGTAPQRKPEIFLAASASGRAGTGLRGQWRPWPVQSRSNPSSVRSASRWCTLGVRSAAFGRARPPGSGSGGRRAARDLPSARTSARRPPAGPPPVAGRRRRGRRGRAAGRTRPCSRGLPDSVTRRAQRGLNGVGALRRGDRRFHDRGPSLDHWFRRSGERRRSLRAGRVEASRTPGRRSWRPRRPQERPHGDARGACVAAVDAPPRPPPRGRPESRSSTAGAGLRRHLLDDSPARPASGAALGEGGVVLRPVRRGTIRSPPHPPATLPGPRPRRPGPSATSRRSSSAVAWRWAWMRSASVVPRPACAASSSMVASRTRFSDAEGPEQRLLPSLAHAGDVLEHALEVPPAHQRLLVGDGEAVRLVAHADQQEELGRVLRQDDGVPPSEKDPLGAARGVGGAVRESRSRDLARATTSDPSRPHPSSRPAHRRGCPLPPSTTSRSGRSAPARPRRSRRVTTSYIEAKSSCASTVLTGHR